MKPAKQKLLLILGLLVLIVAVIIAFIPLSNKNSATNLSDQQIRAKFDCDRTTENVKATDVFCNPDLYRNPNLSEAQYYKYMDCANRLQNPPTSDVRVHDHAYTGAYDICADKTKFNQSRLEFINNLKKLKAQNP